MLENIFSKKVEKNIRLGDSTQDFDITQSLLETLIMIEESYLDINSKHIHVTHLALKDQNINILTEGLGDAMHSVIEFFKKLLKKFTDFMKRIFMVIYAYLGDFNSFITKYKDKLRDLKPDFTIMGYEYSFNPNIPSLNEVSNVISDYNSELDKIDNMKKGDIIKEREEFTSESFMNRVRGKVIGINGEISSDEFLERVKSVYRNNTDMDKDMDEIVVNKSYLDNIISEYPRLKTTIADAIKGRDRIITLINNMKTFFEKSASTYYKGSTKVMGMYKVNINNNSSSLNKGDIVERNYDLQKMDIINTFFNFKYTQSKEIGSICVTAMIEKVNAIKECMNLYKTIIRKSLFQNSEKIEKKVRGES